MIDLGTIPDKEVVEFFKQYYGAFCSTNSFTKRVFDAWKDLELRVSYDKDLHLFVGQTLGFNAMSMRKYLSHSPFMQYASLAIENFHLKNPELIPGGRFFFKPTGIFRKNGNLKLFKVAKWNFRISDAAKLEIDQFIAHKIQIEKLTLENSNKKLFASIEEKRVEKRFSKIEKI